MRVAVVTSGADVLVFLLSNDLLKAHCDFILQMFADTEKDTSDGSLSEKNEGQQGTRLTVPFVERMLKTKKFKLVENVGTSEIWKNFCRIQNLDNITLQFIACKKCNKVFQFQGRKTGTTHLKNHATTCQKQGKVGRISDFCSSHISESTVSAVKQKVLESCVLFCARDLRPFESVKGM